MFLALNGRILYFQTTLRPELENQAQTNQTDLQLKTASRGIIYDRNGIPLVRNAPIYQISIIPIRQVAFDEDVPVIDPKTGQPLLDPKTGEIIYNDSAVLQRISRQAVYARLARLVNQPGVTAGEIFTRMVRARDTGQTFRPVVVVDSVPRETALVIQEQSLLLPGVVVETIGSRIYPYGELFGNMLGYTGRILDTSARRYGLEPGGNNREFLVDSNYGGYKYLIDSDRIGVTGIEANQERELRGQKGEREIVVDVSYEEKELRREITPTVGNNVRLTLDLRLQTIISEQLRYGLNTVNSESGAVVALNPNTGEIIGMIGLPTYDNNLFARGITTQELKLLNDDPFKPQLNHATQEDVAPGSTFKIITTAAIVQETGDNVDEFTQIVDPGIFELPNAFDPNAKGREFFCWIALKRQGGNHGPQTAEEALKNSCDSYYYKAVGGYEPDGIIGIESNTLAKWGRAFGIGEDTYDFGVAYSPGYAASQEGNLSRGGGLWTQGDDYNISIGQGDTRATVLEMAIATSIIANGGTLYEPQIVRDVVNNQQQIVKPFAPKVLRKLPLDDRTMQLIQRGMWRVVNEEGGTAFYNASLTKWNFEYAGKTGTAEFCDIIVAKRKLCPPDTEFQPTHAWYIAYAPAENPQIALAVYVWNGGQGSGVAAPIAARILAKYFNLPIPDEELPKVVKSDSE